MIRPPGFRGAAFGTAGEGDGRTDADARRRLSDRLGITHQWAFVSQVHGTAVVEVARPGRHGEADAIYTTASSLPLAVATADCAPVILEGPELVAVVHAGWRGAAAGVLPATIDALDRRGLEVTRAAIGPSIGPCCYEVGAEVLDRFDRHVARTRWETPSIDLGGYLADQLREILAPTDVWRSDECTYTSTRLHSYRHTRTRDRQVAVGWIPAD